MYAIILFYFFGCCNSVSCKLNNKDVFSIICILSEVVNRKLELGLYNVR